MNIFNVPQEFWEQHTLLYITLIVSLTFNVVSLVGLLIALANTHYERKAKERMEIIEQVVRRVKREMKQNANENK